MSIIDTEEEDQLYKNVQVFDNNQKYIINKNNQANESVGNQDNKMEEEYINPNNNSPSNQNTELNVLVPYYNQRQSQLIDNNQDQIKSVNQNISLTARNSSPEKKSVQQKTTINYIDKHQQYYQLGKSSFGQMKSQNVNTSSDPYLLITVKFDGENSVPKTFIVGKTGLVNSLKNTIIEDLIIGRYSQEKVVKNEISVIPQDISINQKSISRLHCKIDFKSGLKNCPQKLSQEFKIFTWLSIFNKQTQLIYSKKLPVLPTHINKLIWDFLKPERVFRVYDLDSSYGTYVRMNPNVTQKLQRGQAFMLGYGVIVTVIDIGDGMYNTLCEESYIQAKQIGKSLAKTQLIQNIEQYKSNQVNSRKQLFKIIKELKQLSKSKFFIHDQQEESNTVSNDFLDKQDSTSQPQKIVQPFIHLKISTITGLPISEGFIIEPFIPTEKPFVIGREYDCNLQIDQQYSNSMSRKHCCIQYKHDGWYIQDGDSELHFSTYGIYRSLASSLSKNSSQESEPFEFTKQCELLLDRVAISIKAINN